MGRFQLPRVSRRRGRAAAVEVRAAARAILPGGAAPERRASRFVLDGELVVPVGKLLSFDDLLQRIHPPPAASQLSAERPASLIVFDLLAERRRVLVDKPLE